MKRGYLNRTGKSSRSKLYKKMDGIFFEILKIKRGERDEISGRPANGLAPHHILLKGNYPKLRYSEMNCILVNWFPFHYAIHHHSIGHPQHDRAIKGIKRLRGDDYVAKLKMLNSMADRHTVNYLSMLLIALEQELEQLKKG